MLRNVFLLTTRSVMIAASVLLILIWFFSFHPLASILSTDVFKEWQFMLKPEREALLYRFFVLIGLAAQVIGLYVSRSLFQKEETVPFSNTAVSKRVGWRLWELLVVAAIILFIFVPDTGLILMRVTDFFYHIDSFFVAPGWANISGLKLNTDVTSEYSVVVPVLTAKFLNGMGRFDYAGVAFVMMAAACFYFCAFYFFLRIWLDSFTAAALGVLAGIVFQMFHPGVFPIIWQFPSATVIRFFWDIPVLFLILAHARSGREVYLWYAAIFVGVSLVWIVDVGVYLYLAFASYTLMAWLCRRDRPLALAAALLIPWIVALGILWIVEGSAILRPEYWHNTFEFVSLFLQGWGALPMTTSLNEHHYLAFILSLIIPVFYLWTMLTAGTLCFLRRISWENVIAVVLCVYGLGLYHYYVVRSAPTSYAVVCLPAVALVCWVLTKAKSRALWVGSFAVVLGILCTNPLVRDYPGSWNLATRATPRADWQKGISFPEDVDLIRRMTSSGERVALLSSFEVKMLKEAGRKPFFYYFPIFQSDAMGMLQFRGTYLHTHSRMLKTLKALETERPRYVFVEQKFFSGMIPTVYYQRFETLTILMAYLHQNYEPIAQGKYLLALKRKGVS